MDSHQATLTSPDAVVHLEYDITNPPPKPSQQWTRFVCISDTHSRTFPVPDGDILLHSGDLTNQGTGADLLVTMQWLRGLPHPKKIIIAGNHDIALDRNGDWYDINFHRWHRSKEDVELLHSLVSGERTKDAGIAYLEDELCQLRTNEDSKVWTVYGSPWSPYFHNWAFNYQRGEDAERLVSNIPKCDILLTHGPPYQILDYTTTQENVGCEALATRLPYLRPRLHVFGHIHEDHGAIIHQWPVDSNSGQQDPSGNLRTVFVNAANWPMGPKAWRSAESGIVFAAAPFQPVIVDLLNHI